MTRRALILAGGGIRVAWQTGVVTALSEAGLRFEHGDGTSGGIFTLGMLMSGLSPAQMGQRWRALPVRSFVSLLPWREYLRSPTDWAALGGAGGIRSRVLPGLGIDPARIRDCTTMTGSFNVADFTTKRCVAVPHTELDEDRLIAGVSLAGLMPAVSSGGQTWTDAVWIQDANLLEAVRRGCDELWVVWCIGNTARWGRGLLEQYVHMIEMSATAALTAELERIAEINARRAAGEPVHGSTSRVVVHVVHPALPLPLDPDFVAGRIDAETLIAQGYRDAHAYLTTASAQGVPLDDTATRTPVRPVGARIALRVSGALSPGAQEAACHLVVEVDDLLALAERRSSLFSCVGAFEHPTYGYCLLQEGSGTLVGSGPDRRLVVRATVLLAGERHELHVVTPLPRHRWREARTQSWELIDATGTVRATGGGRMSPSQAAGSVLSFEPSGAHDLRDRVRAVRLAHRVVRQGGPQEPPDGYRPRRPIGLPSASTSTHTRAPGATSRGASRSVAPDSSRVVRVASRSPTST